MSTDVDDQDLIDRLGRELGGVVVEAPSGLGARAARRVRQRRLTKVVALVVLVGAVGGGVAAWRHEREDDPSSRIATEPGESLPTTTTSVVHTVAPYVSPTTSTVPVRDGEAPLPRGDATFLWNGTELVVWGGQDSDGVHVDGGLYDPATATWQAIPPGPIPPSEGDVAVLVGDAVVVCCAANHQVPCCSPGWDASAPVAAVYDLATGEWRRTSAPPFPMQYPRGVEDPTGPRAIFVGDDKAMAYEPSTDRWIALADPPVGMWAPDVAAASDRLYAWSTPRSGGDNFGAEYDPAADVWRALPEPPDDAHPTYADIEWTGDALIVWGVASGIGSYPGGDASGVGAIWDPDTRTWTPMARPLPAAVGYEGNAGSQTLLWVDDRLLVHTGSLASGLVPDGSLLLAYDPERDEWRRLPGEFATGWAAKMFSMGDYGVVVLEGGLRFVDPRVPGTVLNPAS